MNLASSLLDPRVERGSHRSLRAALISAIRREIIEGGLEPGKLLNIKELQERFGVALGSVREALCQLAADGLVIPEDQRGFRVAPISEADLADVTETRATLEVLMIRDAIAHGDTGWEADLLGAFHRLTHRQDPDLEYPELHRIFHDQLIAPCRSKWMKRFRATLHEHTERYRQLARRHNDSQRDIDAEHRELMEAALARDADRAAELMYEHVYETARILSRTGLTTP
jgi:GntR family transcriptional regulator, carbon starvation induced regulator